MTEEMTEELVRALGTLDLTLPIAHSSDTAEPQQTVRYEVAEVLGRGGVGEVVRAHDVLLERDVALKSLQRDNPTAMAHFWHEARVTATLDHPAIMPVYDAGALDGEGPFFAMKLVQGQDLHQAVANGSAGNVRRRLEILLRVCDAVAYAHSKSWIHRDLKPDNILLGAYGEVLVADWGLAWSLQSERPGPKAGTPCYMAPEQARGEPHDGRADVYALGGTLWYALTGELPFGDADVDTILELLRAGRGFEPASGVVDGELEAILRRALQVDPRRRYPTVEALRSDIEAWLDGEAVGAAHYTLMQRLARWAGRHRQRLVFGTVVTAAAGLAVGVVGVGSAMVVLQSARVAWQAASDEAVAARRAEEAERARRAQLVDARLATAASHRASGRGGQARMALRSAAEAGGGPGMPLATADVLGRASESLHVWPVEAPVVDLRVTHDRLLVGQSDGRWRTLSLPGGAVVDQGDFGAPLVALLPEGEALTRSGEVLQRVSSSGEVRAEAAWGDQPIHGAWHHEGDVLVQGYGRGVTEPRRFDLETLEPRPLPAALQDRFVMDAFSGGLLLTGPHPVPDRNRPGEVRRWDGKLLHSTPTRRVAAAGSLVVEGIGGRLRRAGSDGDDWRVESRAFRGAGVDDTSVLMVTEDGGGLWLDGATGRLRARLEGWTGRPSDLVVGDGWAAVGGADSVAVWALPDTPVGMLRDYTLRSVRPLPGGRLVALAGASTAEVIDLPTGRSVWRVGNVNPNDVAWSVDRAHLLVSADRLRAYDLLTEAPPRDLGEPGQLASTDSHVVVVRGGQVEWLDAALRVVARTASPDGAYWLGFRHGDRAVFPVNHRAGQRLGFMTDGPGTLSIFEEGGSPDHVGLGGAALPDGRLAFGRQDGSIRVRSEDGAVERWTGPGAAVIALSPYRRGLVAADFDGRIAALDPMGRTVYATAFEGYLRDVAVIDDAYVVVAGSRGLWSLPLQQPDPVDVPGRLLAAHAYRYVEPGMFESADDRLTAAIGRQRGVLTALNDRDDVEARILRAWAKRVGAE